MISVGRLAKMFHLSRTTLLYYDSIGLLKPSDRNEAGYRLYNDRDIEKLSRIMLFREAGTPLEDISNLIEASDISVAALLMRQLGDMNRQIDAIKRQQEVIVRILKNIDVIQQHKEMDKSVWIDMLKLSGINETTADEWHREFEKQSPELHEKFLKLLGFEQTEIASIRASYQGK